MSDEKCQGADLSAVQKEISVIEDQVNQLYFPHQRINNLIIKVSGPTDSPEGKQGPEPGDNGNHLLGKLRKISMSLDHQLVEKDRLLKELSMLETLV